MAETMHDGFGGLMAYDLVPPERILVPCINAKSCGHNHPEPEPEPDVWQIAQDAIDTLASLLEEMENCAQWGDEEHKPSHLQHYEEELAILRQRLKDAEGDDDGDS